jgi:hypothetical protein
MEGESEEISRMKDEILQVPEMPIDAAIYDCWEKVAKRLL